MDSYLTQLQTLSDKTDYEIRETVIFVSEAKTRLKIFDQNLKTLTKAFKKLSAESEVNSI